MPYNVGFNLWALGRHQGIKFENQASEKYKMAGLSRIVHVTDHSSAFNKTASTLRIMDFGLGKIGIN